LFPIPDNEQLFKEEHLGPWRCRAFYENDEALSVQGISEDQLCKKIPEELRYAWIYWANHIKGVHADDADLMKELEQFAMQHLVGSAKWSKLLEPFVSF
jgi:hypothetical protein